MGFPVCCGRASDVSAAGGGLLRLCAISFKENGETTVAVANTAVQKQVNVQRFRYIVLADLSLQSVSGLYENVTRMSYSDFGVLINLFGGKISKNEKYTTFRKAISVQERSALSLRFLESGDTHVSLQDLLQSFHASNQLHRSRSV
jgi:hypothetical protein